MKGEFEMKKILMAICMALMMLSVGVTAFAASGSFTSSPSANRAPTVVEFENASEDCTATIVIYAYADRDSLDAISLISLAKIAMITISTRASPSPFLPPRL